MQRDSNEKAAKQQRNINDIAARQQRDSNEKAARQQRNINGIAARMQRDSNEEAARQQRNINDIAARMQRDSNEEAARQQRNINDIAARQQRDSNEEAARQQRNINDVSANEQRENSEIAARKQPYFNDIAASQQRESFYITFSAKVLVFLDWPRYFLFPISSSPLSSFFQNSYVHPPVSIYVTKHTCLILLSTVGTPTAQFTIALLITHISCLFCILRYYTRRSKSPHFLCRLREASAAV